jgi:hypothetical protein
MSDAARLASQAFSQKPLGISYAHFSPSAGEISAIQAAVEDAVVESTYAAVVSYAEAMSGLQHGSISWSIVRLYYSCFYSLRALLLLNEIVPFNYRGEMLLDIPSRKFLKGGASSHHWNWTSVRKSAQLSGMWFVSSDSEETYEKLRKHRENVNYTHAFTDPALHRCLVSGESDLIRRFRLYRDDGSFLYTYLTDHLAIAYPTKLIFSLDASLRVASLSLPPESISHARKIWSMKDRCPAS